MSQIIPGAEPFLFNGGSSGCLLIHGFTGTPHEMCLLGEHLSDEGYTVLGIRLAGHATRKEDMARMRWQDWLADVEDGCNLLRSNCERIILMGLSMGGILALTYAARQSVDGLVIMATPHHLPPDIRVPILKPLSLFIPYIKKGPPQWADMQAYAAQLSYAEEPLRSMAEVSDLLAVMRAGLPQVNAPALLIYSRNDPTVPVAGGHAQAILAALGSQRKELQWIEGSGHILTRDARREEVFRAAAAFTHSITGKQL
jgi:carboxylesterase